MTRDISRYLSESALSRGIEMSSEVEDAVSRSISKWIEQRIQSGDDLTPTLGAAMGGLGQSLLNLFARSTYVIAKSSGISKEDSMKMSSVAREQLSTELWRVLDEHSWRVNDVLHGPR